MDLSSKPRARRAALLAAAEAELFANNLSKRIDQIEEALLDKPTLEDNELLDYTADLVQSARNMSRDAAATFGTALRIINEEPTNEIAGTEGLAAEARTDESAGAGDSPAGPDES